ncbi:MULTISPECIES: hypothetical protein [Hyphobacterium]|uniref:Metallo-beta-lactamase domain-containing protein n=1 Tax=Hyphobacterium vulgare TaxID=1736751 RepID=A0ABV6ZX49_9PROT
MNRFFCSPPGGGPIDEPGSNRLIARIDEIESYPRDEGEFTAFLGAVETRFLEKDEISRRDWQEAPISILRVEVDKEAHDPLSEALREQRREGSFFNIELGAGRGESSVFQHISLFDEGIPRAIYKAVPIDGLDADVVRGKHDLSDVEEADQEWLEDRLTRLDSQLRTARIYDVGQGSCAALLTDGGKPRLFLDAGRGVLANTRTFDREWFWHDEPTHICGGHAGLVLLSHWDWDHWAYAAKEGLECFQERIWIAPKQEVSAIHRAFAAQLDNLRLWPTSASEIRTATLKILKANGTSRNDSGLVTVWAPTWAKGDGVLFPGDCAYGALPGGLASGKYHAVVASHHGAESRPDHIAPPPHSLNSQWIISSGARNTFGHPTRAGHRQFTKSGWSFGQLRITSRQSEPRWPRCIGDIDIR